MENLFLAVLKLSMNACYIIVFVLIVRMLLRKTPKIFSYFLWTVVFLKLISPFSFESIISLIPYQVSIHTIEENIMTDTVMSRDQIGINTKSGQMNITTNTNMSDAFNKQSSIMAYLSLIWLIGIIIIITYNMISFLKLKKSLSTATRVKDNLYETAEIHTPFVMGLLSPKIYLPVELGKEEKIYIIQHEQIHIQRRDYLIKMIAFCISCIHWFNPLVWYSFILLNHDMEMSCDEKVIQKLGNKIKKDYSSSLLSLAVNQGIPSRIPIAFGENNVKRRIRNILNYKRPALWIIIASAIIVIVVCVGLFFDPSGSRQVKEISKNPIGTVSKEPSIAPGYDKEDSNQSLNNDNATGTVVSTDSEVNVNLSDTKIEDVADDKILEYLKSTNGKLLKEMTDSFVKAYFSNDKEMAYKYLAKDAEYDSYVYQDAKGKRANVYEKLNHLLAKWYHATDKKANVQYEYEVKGEDSFTYLDLELVCKKGTWIISGIYLEK